MTQTGEAMVYGFTIPENAPNKKVALAFAAFLMESNKGMIIMAKNGQPPLVKPQVKEYDQLPEVLKGLTTHKK